MIMFLINFTALKVPLGLGIHACFLSASSAITLALYSVGSNFWGPWGWQIQSTIASWFLLAKFIAIQLFNLSVVRTNSFKPAEYKRFVIGLVLVATGSFLGKIIFLALVTNAALFSVGLIYVCFLIPKYELLIKLIQCNLYFMDWFLVYWCIVWRFQFERAELTQLGHQFLRWCWWKPLCF